MCPQYRFVQDFPSFKCLQAQRIKIASTLLTPLNFTNFTENTCSGFFFEEVARCRALTLLKKILSHLFTNTFCGTWCGNNFASTLFEPQRLLSRMIELNPVIAGVDMAAKKNKRNIILHHVDAFNQECQSEQRKNNYK